MSYPVENFTAAAKRLHNNYSETAWEDSDYGEQSWAAGTLRGIIADLGPSEEFTAARVAALGLGVHLTKAWEAAGGDPAEGFGTQPQLVASAVTEAIEKARGPREEIEITDAMVNSVALDFFGPSVVYDREKLRAALANALQTR